MRPKLSLKTLYRSPVRTILTFILLAAVTFALVSQVLEYSVAKRETEKAVELYDGILNIESGKFTGTNESVPAYIYSDKRVSQGVLPTTFYERYQNLGYAPLSQEQIDTLSALPYVTYIDTRYMTAGVSEYRRLDEGVKYYEYTNICVVEATVKFYNSTTMALVVSDLSLVGGEPIRNSGFGDYDIFIMGEASYMLEDGGRELYYLKNADRTTTVATKDSIYDSEYLETLNVGERYVFVLRYEDELVQQDTYTYFLTDPFVYGQCDAVYSLKGEPENYLETEKFAPLREYINIIETDQYTLDVVYAKNMNSIRYFADKTIGISEGRALTLEDTENENNVCVIHHDFALEYGVEIGDTITVELGNKLFSQNKAVGAVSVVKERMSTSYTTAELEIVGIFKDNRNKYADIMEVDTAWAYGKNTVFVPQHLLNVEKSELENHKFYPGEVSFVVEEAWETPNFEKEIVPKLESEGYTVYFEDGGFKDLISPIKASERIAAIKMLVLMIAVFAVTYFVSVLYVAGRKRDYAIMRLLGTTKSKSARALLLPLLVIAAAAAIIGSTAAYIYTVLNIADSQAISAIAGYDADLSIPVYLIIVCLCGEIALTLILMLASVSSLSKKSPLALMQANSQKHRRQRKKKNYVAEPAEPVVLGEWESIERLVPSGKKYKGKFVFRYVLRHIRRTVGKAVLFILIAVLLINLLGQLLIMRNSYLEIFNGTEIRSNYAGLLNLSYVDKLQQSGYVKDLYYCGKTDLMIDFLPKQGAIVCSDIYMYAKENGITEPKVTYLEGYDDTSTHKLSSVILMGEDYMKECGYELGDVVEIMSYDTYQQMVVWAIINFETLKSNGEVYTDEEILEIEGEELYRRFRKYHTENFTIIGSVSGEDKMLNSIAFLPGSTKNSKDFGQLVIVPSVTAVLEDNWQAEEYRAFGEELADANGTGEVAFVMDTSKLDNVKNNIELMNTLYPIMIAAVMVIGAFLCGMLIVQNSKDIAIMRVLGTSKRRVRAIMVLEHMILCIVGIALAVAVLAARGVLTQMLLVIVLYVVVIFAASYVASVLASRKNVLELLQTKE
ncbi:MAG: hypothetical protein IJ017_04025 [Oscillospiraceae bacterium]|nr:hypothetical protein [Oscillospiraceae bacterium]